MIEPCIGPPPYSASSSGTPEEIRCCDSPGDIRSGATGSVTFGSPGPGRYCFALFSRDDFGRAGRPVFLRITVPDAPPTASFDWSQYDTNALQFDDSSSDPDGRVVAWHWEFGDGAVGNGRSVTHTYAASGQYQVRLTVTDDGGATATTSRSVTATAGGGP